MKKNITLCLIIIVTFIFSSCIIGKKLPSVCDKNKNVSYLCTIAEKHGVRLESIGVVLVIANAVAISEGKYTTKDALQVLKGLRSTVENPVSYLFFKAHIDQAVKKYPGLLAVADIYLDDLNFSQIMYPADRVILMSWLDARIAGLEAFL